LLTQLTTALTVFITHLYATTGLAGIVLAMAIESCCIPLPSEIVMPLAGVMVANGTILRGTNPVVSLVLVALAGAVGCLLGSVVAYWIGYTGGRPLMLKYGRYVLISQHDAEKADRFFQRWGSATAFFSRLLPVVRTYISLPAGIAKMPFVKFCIYTLLGSFPWCLLLAYGGYVLGNHLDTLAPIFHGLDIVIVVGVVVLVALYVWRHIRNDRKARAAAASAGAAAGQQVGQQNGWTQQAPSQSQWGQPPQQPYQQQWSQSQGQFPQPQQWGQPASEPVQQWGQGQSQPPSQPQWNQPQPPAQQWSQQQPQQQQWNQPQQQPRPQWGQPQWGQEQPQAQPQQWGQPQAQPQPQWDQGGPQQPRPSQWGNDDPSVQRR
jgi:membrane protein DedA with SNARE-associated domain